MSNCCLCKITEIFLINFWYQQFSLKDYGGLKWSFASNTKFVIIWLYYFCSYTISAIKNTMHFGTILGSQTECVSFFSKIQLMRSPQQWLQKPSDDCFFHYFLGFLYSLFTGRGSQTKTDPRYRTPRKTRPPLFDYVHER